MEYRRLDYSNDKEEVVAVIRRNLNSNYSQELLKWKHLESPFGMSVGLVAVESNKIVGVVFAALYKFQNNSDHKIRSVRFFDACTEPDQRGKGIFKTLMKMGFETYQNLYDFSFSNPNEASLKGHLRVGYKEPKNKMFYRLGLLQPKFGRINSDLIKFEPGNLDHTPLAKQNYYLAGNSISFIKWRYREERYRKLVHLDLDQRDYIIYRIEKKIGIRTIVLCDYFGDINKIHKVMNKVCRKEKTFLIYYLENRVNANLKFLYTRKYKKAVVVFKNDHTERPHNLVISLGDLEGRL